MIVVTESEDRTIRTAAGLVASLATPSRGSKELATWRARMEPGAEGPLHSIDREQVWMPLTGSFSVTVDDETQVIGAGQALVLPADVLRQITCGDEPAEALICMPVGGTAAVPDNPERRELPWAR